MRSIGASLPGIARLYKKRKDIRGLRYPLAATIHLNRKSNTAKLSGQLPRLRIIQYKALARTWLCSHVLRRRRDFPKCPVISYRQSTTQLLLMRKKSTLMKYRISCYDPSRKFRGYAKPSLVMTSPFR